MTQSINSWCNNREEKFMKMCMILPSLLLQRTSKKGKARENKAHLERRLKLWEAGKYDELVEEGKAIQNRFEKNNGDKGSGNDFVKQFRLQMMNGNVNGALRLLSNSGSTGVLKINDETIQQLHEKHPQGEPLYSEMLLYDPVKKIVHPVDFSAALVQKVGPSKGWAISFRRK